MRLGKIIEQAHSFALTFRYLCVANGIRPYDKLEGTALR